MYKTTLIILLSVSCYCFSQNNNLSLQVGYAHFDDSNGFVLGTSYSSDLNRYLDWEVSFAYAKTNDFPENYRFSDNLGQTYWHSKSTIFTLSPHLHLVFIRSEKHKFSFYGGLGAMFIDAVDNSKMVFSENEFNFQSNVETYTTISKTIGIRYSFFIKNNYGFGIDANLNSPLSSNDKYFGQDNYRSVSLLVIKSF